MPILVDGNNLMYALRKAGQNVDRDGVARLLAALAKGKERICVIFDGPMPRFGSDELADAKLEILYSLHRQADELLAERIAANTAPRRLVVVSTDREVRKIAKHRGCQSVTSEEFVPLLFQRIERLSRPRVREPSEKQKGLTSEQAEQWLKELGLDEETEEQ
jgi:predicted RNA-binding protein with PIN domain